MTGIEPMRHVAVNHGLTFGGGVEAYYTDGGFIKKGHLVLLALDHVGEMAIGKAVSSTQQPDGKCLFTEGTLVQYFAPGKPGHGHVVVTTACVNGVPALCLRANEDVERRIVKLRDKLQNAGISKASREQAARVKRQVTSCEADIQALVEEGRSVEKIANLRFANRERSLEKYRGTPEYERLLEELNEDKRLAEEAKKRRAEIMTEKARASRRLSVLREDLKAKEKLADAYKKGVSEYRSLKAMLMPPEAAREKAQAFIRMLRDVFGEGNAFVEVQYHGMQEEAEVFPVLTEIARENGIPLVASNDIHIPTGSEEDILQRQLIRAKRFGKWEEASDADKELFPKTDRELAGMLLEILPEDAVREAISNIRPLVGRIVEEGMAEKHYPGFKCPPGETPERYLKKLIKEGIRKRFPKGFPEGKEEEYRERIRYEYRIIQAMGVVSYFLIVQELISYAVLLGYVPDDGIKDAPLGMEELREFIRENGWSYGGIVVGPGRGSAAGSEICYLIGITNIDPILHGLLFERFLNPERFTMPDIDIDIAFKVRYKVIEHLRHLYGENAVCGILTMNYLAPKGAIREAGRYYMQRTGNDTLQCTIEALAKAVPHKPGTAFSSRLGDKTVYEAIEEQYADNPPAREILSWAKVLEGCFVSYGTHAAGIVISDNDDITDYVPLRWNDSLGEYVSQVDKELIEAKGLLKIDLLGLRTLDVLNEAAMLVYQQTGNAIDFDTIPLDDPEIYRNIYANGNTEFIFQFESGGMRQNLISLRAARFEDLVIMNAMYRPGPMQFIPDVIKVKNGEKPQYVTAFLEPILGDTYGAIVFQEQVMQIFRQLAGYSYGEADKVRRYMSKKKEDPLKKERQSFLFGDPERGICGCLVKGVTEEQGNKLFDQMEKFAEYAFNKSHAAAYSDTSFKTAWMKYYHPAEFLAAAVNVALRQNKDGALNRFVKACRDMGISILPPDINLSGFEFTVSGPREIRFGLGSVRSVRSSVLEAIGERMQNGPYISLCDFVLRTRIKRNAAKNLIDAGAFDSFNRNRASIKIAYESLLLYKAKIKDKEVLLEKWKAQPEGRNYRNALAGKALFEESMRSVAFEPVVEDMGRKLLLEKELTGAYISAHPLDMYEPAASYGAVQAADIDRNTKAVMGVINEVRTFRTKKEGAEFAFLEVEDLTGAVEAAVYPTAKVRPSGRYGPEKTVPLYAKYKDMLIPGAVCLFKGYTRAGHAEEMDEKGDVRIVEAHKFVVESVEYVRPVMKAYQMSVPSLIRFHLDTEGAFRKDYEDPEGHFEQLCALAKTDIYLDALLHTTCAATMASASEQDNILPTRPSVI
ncbi:MAG: DNA polymerase III subunit alpha, partial [Eubacteriales bacterium]